MDGRTRPAAREREASHRPSPPKETSLARMREFQLERYYARHEFTTPYQLSASDCETLAIADVLELSGRGDESFLGLRLGYTETRGNPELREVIAGFYPGCELDDVLVCSAPEEAIFLAMHALVEPGTPVVVQTPCYQSLKEIARGLGGEMREWALAETGHGWRIDLDRLEGLLDGARVLVTNAPHNPTGFQPSQDEWRRIRDLCSARGVRWFSDEMYRGLEFERRHALAPAAVLQADALSLWGMSKSFGLPGLRIGWLVCRDRSLLARIEALKDYTSICSNAPGEFLARVALGAADTILRRNRTRLAENERMLEGFVQRHAGRFSWLRPKAGPVSLLRLRAGSAEEHARRAREEAGVLLVPSTLFDLGDSHLRVGLGRASFGEALERLEAAGF